MKVKIKKLHPDAVIPRYAKPGDAGLDLTAIDGERKGHQMIYSTGLAIEIPDGHVGLIFPRSSISKTDLNLCNAVGVVDSKFRGEVTFKFNIVEQMGYYNCTLPANVYEIGDRIGQLVILPYPSIELEEVNELSETERGTDGWGSTGK